MDNAAFPDCELVKQLGFEEHPKSPIVIVQPSQPKQWLLEHLAIKDRIRRSDKLMYIASVAKQHEQFDAKLVDLEVLNRCLREHIESTFFRKHHRRPKCSLDEFLYSPIFVASQLSMPKSWRQSRGRITV